MILVFLFDYFYLMLHKCYIKLKYKSSKKVSMKSNCSKFWGW